MFGKRKVADGGEKHAACSALCAHTVDQLRTVQNTRRRRMGEVNKEFIVLYHSVQCRPVEKSAEHYKEGMVVHSSVEGGRGGGSREMVDRQH